MGIQNVKELTFYSITAEEIKSVKYCYPSTVSPLFICLINGSLISTFALFAPFSTSWSIAIIVYFGKQEAQVQITRDETRSASFTQLGSLHTYIHICVCVQLLCSDNLNYYMEEVRC